jgi:AcrR family transcriptional regulator
MNTAPNRRIAAPAADLAPGILPEGTRGGILNAALRLFAEKGYGGTSVRDIAAIADVQPATMYAHFPSKEHVLAELIKLGHEAHHQRLRTALLQSQPDPREQVAALVRAHVRAHAEFPTLAVVANSELHALSPAAAAPAVELRKQSQQLLGDVIQRGIELGVFDVADPYLAVAAIGAMGLRVANWYTPDSGRTADQVADTYAKFACRLLGAK